MRPGGKRALSALILCASLIPAGAKAESALWSSHTAFTVPPGRTELSLSSPSHYALGEHHEVSADMVLLALLPNAGYKRAWPALNAPGRLWAVSTSHRASTSKVLRRVLDGEQSPWLLSLESDLLLSAYHEPSRTWLTPSLGVVVTPRLGQHVQRIDDPLLSLRAGDEAWAPRAGLSVDTVLGGQLYGRSTTTLTLLLGAHGVSVEQRVELSYRLREWHVGAGVLGSWMERGGTRALRLIPTLDLGVAIF